MNKKHESWFKALSFLCILSLVLSLIPPVGIWQSVKADDVTLYNGGLDSYNGLSYTEWAKKAGVKPTLDVTINGTTKTLHFNSEIYAERGQVVYGEPDDVPANHLVSPAGFKPAPDGYFYAVKQSNGSYRLALPGTAGAVRGWFRYLGYSMSKAPFSDPRFPPDYTPEVITPDKLVPISSVPASAKDALGLTGYDPSKVSPNDWQLLFQNLYLLKEYDSGTNQTLKQLLVDSGKVTSWTGLSTYVAFLGVDQNNNASARIIWKDSTGRLRYRTYSGFIPQGGSPKVTTEGVGGSIVSGLSFVSGSSTSTIAGAVLRYDPAKTDKPAVNIYIDGKLEDDLGSHYVEPYYDRMTLTRNDVQTYQTRIVNITINGQSAINSEITKWRDAIVIGQDSNTVSFRTEVEGRYFEIPTSLLKPGNNNVVVTGETRVVFDTGNGTKTVVSENTATMSFTIKVDVNLQPPQLQLSVTPSQSTITITNGQYSPSQYVTHNISAKVTVPSLPAGYQITAMEFYIDTSNPPAGNVISKTITNGLATNYSFDSIKTFQYDASKIPLKTDGTGQGTPAYYGKVRYQLQSISNPSQTQWSGWSSVAWTKAEVDVKATGGIVTADLTADKTSISGKEGDKVTVVLTTNATLSNKPAGTKVTQWKIYLRESNETQPNPIATTSNDQNTFSASRNYTFTLKSGMTSIKFVTRAYCTLSNGTTLNGYDDITIPVSITTPQQDQQPGEVICDGVISPQTAQATKNPFTGQIDPPTTDVQVGVSASISSTGGKKISKWDLYCNGELIETITGNNTSVSAPLGTKTYTVDNNSSQQFEFRAVVTFTDGTTKEGTDTEIFGAQQVTLSNNPPYVWVSATPKVVPQGDDVYITTSYYDPDAPLGDSIKDVSITVTPLGDYFDGRLFWSSKVGSYTATATVTDSLGLSATATDSFSVIPAIPQPKLYTFGTLKENRKVILDGSYSYAGSKRAQIDWSKAKWTITPVTGDIDPTSIKTVESLEGSSKLTCLFKQSGRYKVTLTLTNNYGNSATETWYIEIKPDEPPVASYTCPTKIIRDPNDSSKATVQLTSNSYSPDDDVIAKHAWLYAWDSNNDGNFDDETWYALKSDGTWQQINLSTFDIDNFDCGNLTTATIKTNNVGKYEVKLIVKEEFGQETIPQFVTSSDRKSAQIEQTVEVINVAPIATLNASKTEIKKVNITVLTDKTGSAYNQIVGKLNQLKADLYPYGVYVTINSYDGTNTTQNVGNTEKAYSCGLLRSWLNYDFDDVIAASNIYGGYGIGVGVKNGTYYVFRYDTSSRIVNTLATLGEKVKSVKFLADRNGFFSVAYILTTSGNLYQCLYSERIASLIGRQIAGPLNYQFILMGTGIQEIEMLWRNNYQGPGPGFSSNTRGDFHSSIILRFKKSTGYGNVEVYKIQHHITDFWSSSYEDRNAFLFFGSWYYSPNYKTFTYSYDVKWSGYSNSFYDIYDSISPCGTMDLNNWPVYYYTDYWPYFSAVLKDKYGRFCDDTIYDYTSDYPRMNSSDLNKFVSLVPLYDYSTAAGSISTDVSFNFDPSNPMWVQSILNWFLEEPSNNGWIYTVTPYSGAVQSLKQVIPKAVLSSSKYSTLIGQAYIDQNNNYSSFSGYYTIANVADMYVPNADKEWINKSGTLVFRSGSTIYRTLSGGYPYAIGYVNTPVISLSAAPIITNYREDSDNYTIYVSDTQGTSGDWGQYFSFWSIDKMLLNFMTRYNVKFFGVTPSTNFDKLYYQQQVTLRQLANATDGKLYDSQGNAITTLDQALADIKAKYTNVQFAPDPVYVLADEERVVYYPYWQDYENDTIINQRWRYEHDETVFDNSQGKAEFDGVWLNNPIEVFNKVGKYTITFQVQDSPPPGSSDFDEYKLWSKLERQMVLYVHRRPIADFTAVYNKSTGKLTITDKSYDPDHQYNRTDKGIINWKWQYKTIDDNTWTDTTLSNLQSMTLQSGKVYLIKLEVQDCDGPNGVGVWSKPKIAMIDLTTSNNPPVADFVVDSEILKGNQPSNLQDKSYDPDGDTITAWHWWIYNSDGSTNKDFGETTNNNISTIKSYIATMPEGSYRLALQVKDSNNNYSAVTSKWFKIYSPSKDTEPDAVNNPPAGTFTMTITNHRTKLKPTTTYSDPDGDPKNAEQWYIKFNEQTRYFDRLPDTLESAGYIYDGTYEIGYRVQDNPTSRSTKLKPLWSNWYVQTYYISSDITIQAWTEKFAKRAKNMTEVPSIVKNTIKTSDFKLGEGIIIKAKTTGYVEKIEVWFDTVDTPTPKEGKVTKVITGYWECSIKNGTMTLNNLHTVLYPEDTVKNREISYEAVKGKKPLPAPVFTTVPYSMNWSSDIFDPKLQPKFIISNNNSYVKEKWPDRYRDLWDGLYKWSDWPLGDRFSYAKAMEIYGRPPYLIKGDVLHIKLRAYKRNANGSYTTKDIDLPVNIVGSIEIGTGEIN